MRFSDHLREQAKGIWEAIFVHPFVGELGQGSLPPEKYLYYIKQDYVYLLDFSRCLGIAAAKAASLDDMSTLSGLMNGCLSYEMNILGGHLAELGLTREDISGIVMAPTNHAYTRHMLAVAYSGSVAENLASLLPCMWTYQLIGEKLWEERPETLGGHYLEWVEGYRSAEYRGLVDKYRALIDGLGEAAGRAERSAMVDHFVTSSRYEYMFWDMAYRMETWPV
ncbi:MAG TPA: thiaminase II [Candidatus Desulfaltia sp.]|nr:thiaminase II [Candidatus Desulfaltia sp.]